MVTSKSKAGLSLADREMVAMGQELKNRAKLEYYRRFVEALELYGMSTSSGDGGGGNGRDYSSKTSSWSKIARFMGDEVSVAEVKKYAYRYLMYIQSRGDGAPPSVTGTGTAVSHGGTGPLPVTNYFNPSNTSTPHTTNTTNTHHSVPTPTLTLQSTPATDGSDGWTVEEDILLETILVPYHEANHNHSHNNHSDELLAEESVLTHDWQRIASIIPGKTAWQVEHRYRTHVLVERERERNRTNQDVAPEPKPSGTNTQSGTSQQSGSNELVI